MRNRFRKIAIDYDNPQQWVNEQARANAADKRRKVVNKSRSSKTDSHYLDLPFALVTRGEKGTSYQVIHKSIPAYSGINETGEQYARGLKRSLVSTGARRFFIPKESYAANDKIKRLAPFGIEAFDPEGEGDEISESLDRTLRGVKQTRRQKKRNGAVTSDNLDPDSIESIVKTYGKNSLIRLMTSAYGGEQKRRVGDNLCVCGSSAEDHDGKDHKFLPQEVNGDVSGFKARLTSNPLLKSLRTKDGKTGFFNAFDEDGPEGTFMPVVRASVHGDQFQRYDTAEEQLADATPFNEPSNEEHTGYERCGCSNGRIDRNQLENSAFCRDCRKGNVNYKAFKTKEGNKVMLPYTVGTGTGLRYANPVLAPKCNLCKGTGGFDNGDGTIKKCANHNCVNGHDMREIECKNCHSNHNQIQLTPDNKCPDCNGTGWIKSDEPEEAEAPTAKFRRIIKYGAKYTGMGRFAIKLNDENPEKGVDAWAAHRDPNCKICKDDNYVSEYGTPCECRIRGADDPHVMLPGTKLIHKTGFYIPERDLQHVINKIYPDPDTRPHDFKSFPQSVDPNTNSSSNERYKTSGGFDYIDGTANEEDPDIASRFTGIVQNGMRPPKEVIDRLYKKSQEHWKAPNAHYTAPSRDLEAIRAELTNADKWPDIIPMPSGYDSPKEPEEPTTARFNLSLVPSHLRKGISSVESTVGSLPDAKSGRYNVVLDKMYGHLKNNDVENFNNSREQLLDMVQRFNGKEPKALVDQSLSSLPSISQPTQTPIGKTKVKR